MMDREIRVLVIDDSAFMRKAIGNMLQSDPGIKVVGTARDGAEGLKMTLELSPDVVTLDIEMPVMDGVATLKAIMEKKPTPVIMVSSLTTEGAKATLECLSIGAVDFIPKNLSDLSANIVKIKEELISKVRAIAGKRVRRTAPPAVKPRDYAPPREHADYARPSVHGGVSIVAIGTSTGGPKALQEMMPHFPANFPVPILIVQHMPPVFTSSFAQKLNETCQIEVVEASEGEPLKSGKAFLAPGGMHMKLKRIGHLDLGIRLDKDPGGHLHVPSVDVMMTSVAEFFPRRCLGVILTGMGCDGKEGMGLIKASGGKTIAQDEGSCIVYGMPKAVAEAGLADKVVPLEYMAGEIINMI